jgi:radical SAM superfamily enzyme
MAERKVTRLWIADANFGIFERDVAIADVVCDAQSKYGYPRDVIVNYAKNATVRLAEIIRRFRRAKLSATGIISIQTHDPTTLENVSRANIKTERYEELIEIFRNEGLPVSSDLLIGLPGATVAAFKDDLQFFIDRQVHTVAYPVMVLPNSPMGDKAYIDKFGITLDANGYIVSTNSFTRMDLFKMKMIFGLYRVTLSSPSSATCSTTCR